jgi:hypothetical protein
MPAYASRTPASTVFACALVADRLGHGRALRDPLDDQPQLAHETLHRRTLERRLDQPIELRAGEDAGHDLVGDAVGRQPVGDPLRDLSSDRALQHVVDRLRTQQLLGDTPAHQRVSDRVDERPLEHRRDGALGQRAGEDQIERLRSVARCECRVEDTERGSADAVSRRCTDVAPEPQRRGHDTERIEKRSHAASSSP